MNILLLANELRYTCGVTNHLLHLTRGLSLQKNVKLRLICGGGNGLERFRDINIEITADKRFLHGERNIPSYTSAIIYLTKFIYRNKINIVHSHSHYTANIARHASKLRGTCTVQTNHGILETGGRLKHFNAKYYIAVNEHINDFLVENGIAKKSNTSFIRCGIPVPVNMPVKDISRLKVIAASRFTQDKGLDLFIKAIKLLEPDTRSKADFIIAGEGELKKELMSLNKETAANISFPGSVKDIYRILASSHILVHPSRSKTEGFPAIITEAGANGLLVISSDFEGAKDVIENNRDGILFRMNDEADLAKKLSLAINHFEKYKKMTEGFYSKIKDWYSVDLMISKHMELYRKCLKT